MRCLSLFIISVLLAGCGGKKDALTDKNPATRRAAVLALGEGSAAILAKAADDGDKSVRQAVIQAALRLNDSAALPVLYKLLGDPDWFLRGNAALALGKIGNADSVPELFKALADVDPYVRKSARLSLQRLATPDNAPAYQAALNSTVSGNRVLAALLLSVNGNPAAVQVLVEELNNSDSPDLSEIIQTLAKTKAPAALPALRQLAADSAHADVQLNAILALGEYKDKASLEWLKKLQKNPDTPREIKTACAVALNNIAKK